jgi:hypothetical protein
MFALALSCTHSGAQPCLAPIRARRGLFFAAGTLMAVRGIAAFLAGWFALLASLPDVVAFQAVIDH